MGDKESDLGRALASRLGTCARQRRSCASRGTFRAGLACGAVPAVVTSRAATRMGKVVYVSHNLAQDTMLETFLQKELVAWLKAVGLIAAPPGR
jgi:hypothetical protein